MALEIPVFITTTRMSKRTGVHRSAITRMVAVRLVTPAAWMEVGDAGEPQPLFRTDQGVDVLRNAQAPRSVLEVQS